MYCCLLASFSFAYHWVPGLPWLQVLLFCVWGLYLGTYNADYLRGRTLADWLPISMCGLALAFGTMLGLYNYWYHTEAYAVYVTNRAYTNVLPSEPAAAHADAGKLVFSDSARVDTSRSVGFMDRSVYCAAPILDESPSATVGFWAVGLDCCGARGSFWCDQAAEKTARSGVVFLDQGLFWSHRESYMKAVRQAAAVYGFVPEQEPIFVRWVKDPVAAQDEALAYGVGILLVSVAAFALFVAVVGVAIVSLISGRGRRPGPMAKR